MLAVLIVWALCSLTQTNFSYALLVGTPFGGDRQVNPASVSAKYWSQTDPGLRKLLQDAEAFVTGGQDAPEGRFPYACSLRTLGPREHGCGGTLIAPGWVLTAAHCVKGKDSVGPTPVVYVGAHGINDDSSAEVIQAVNVFIHESYTGDIKDGFDIALLQLKQPSTRQPATLPHSNISIGISQIVVTAGWGRTTRFGPLPGVLQVADTLEYTNSENCKFVWPDLKENMLCAHGTSQSTCKGDSGGPLLIPDTKGGNSITDGTPGFDVIVGIVSFGPSDCGQTEEGKFKPGVYTRVSSFRQWIDEKMKSASSGSETAASTSTPVVPPTASDDQPEPAKGCSNKEECDKIGQELATASGNGDLDMVKELLSKGASVEFVNEQGWSALMSATQSGHFDIVQVLINAGADVNGATHDASETPLIFSTYPDNPDLVRLLLDNGAAVDQTDAQGETALHEAALYGSVQSAQVLLEAGASIDTSDRAGRKPVDVICGCEAFVGSNLAQCVEGRCGDADKQRLKDILGAQEAVSRGSDNIDQQLSLAATEGNIDTVKELLSQGASVEFVNEQGWSALMGATQSGHFDIVQALINAGADVNGATHDAKETPLIFSTYPDNPDLVRLLLDNGAAVDQPDAQGETALHEAALYGSVQSAQVLLEAGASIDALDSAGRKSVDVICGCEAFVGLDLAQCVEGRCGDADKERLNDILQG